MHALILCHDHISTAEDVEARLVERGYSISHHTVVPEEIHGQPNVTTDFPDFTQFDVVVLMGALASAYDPDQASWVEPEIAQVRAADAAGVPVLGICFGGQILAQTHGGRVLAAEQPELGWVEIDSDDDSIVPGGTWFAWHNDRWDLPPEATELARNAAASHAFVLRRNLAVQFHPEINSDLLQHWYNNNGDEHVAAHGRDPAELMQQTKELDPVSYRRTRDLVDCFLDQVAFPS